MRTLKFVVNDQIITQDPNCDFDNLVPGSEGYLQAEFSFSPEWNDCTKVAAFYSVLGKEYPPQILTEENTCMIPSEALKKSFFKISIVGRSSKVRLTTNRITVCQNGGNA